MFPDESQRFFARYCVYGGVSVRGDALSGLMAEARLSASDTLKVTRAFLSIISQQPIFSPNITGVPLATLSGPTMPKGS